MRLAKEELPNWSVVEGYGFAKRENQIDSIKFALISANEGRCVHIMGGLTLFRFGAALFLRLRQML